MLFPLYRDWWEFNLTGFLKMISMQSDIELWHPFVRKGLCLLKIEIYFIGCTDP